MHFAESQSRSEFLAGQFDWELTCIFHAGCTHRSVEDELIDHDDERKALIHELIKGSSESGRPTDLGPYSIPPPDFRKIFYSTGATLVICRASRLGVT